MKKLIFTLLIIMSIFSFSKDLRKIQVKGISEVSILPNKTSIQLEISTKNKDLSKATELNTKLLEKYKILLNEENISYEKINSIDFFTNKEYNYKDKVINKGEYEYETTLKIDINTNINEVLKDFITILSNYKIYKITKNLNKSYSFEIKIKDKNKLNAKKMALKNLEDLKKEFSKIGINDKNIELTAIENNNSSLEKFEKIKVEEYNVTHKIQIETKDFKNIGKIIDLANELDINTPNYIKYHFNNDKIQKKLYNNAYKNAFEKAQEMAKKNNLTLKNPIKIIDNSYDIHTLNIYFDNEYNSYYKLKNANESSLQKKNRDIIMKVNENSTTIIPKKQNIIKELYIEFEIE